MPGGGIRPAVLACALLALGPAAAAAEPPWLASETVSAPGEQAESGSLVFAVAPSGDAVAAWTVRRDGRFVVRAATRDVRGRWSSPTDLSAPIAPAPPFVSSPLRAVIGPAGDAAVAWAASGALTVAARPGASGAWRAPETVAPAGPPGIATPGGTFDLAMEPTGTLIAIWTTPDLRSVASAVRPAATGVWSAPQSVMSSPTPVLIDLRANRGGASAARIESVLGPLHVAIRPPGGSFSAPEELPGGNVLPRGLAIGPTGELVAVRAEGERGSSRAAYIEAAIRPPDGPFGFFARVSLGSSVFGAPNVAVDGRGNALAAWTQIVPRGSPPRGVTARNVIAERPAGGDWHAPATVGPRDFTISPRALVSNAGGAAVLLGFGERGLEALLRPAPGRPFEPAEAVLSAPLPPEPAPPGIDDDGVAVVAYTEGGRVRSVLRARASGGDVRLGTAQLRINQRISQAAVRRANAIEAVLAEGLTAADIRPGGLSAVAFAAGVRVTGQETGALIAPGPGRRLVVPAPRRDAADALRLTATQLRINQRISQAAVRRANRLAELFDGELTGAHVADGAIGLEHLAPGLAIAGAAVAPVPAPPAPEPTGQRGESGRVTLSVAQLRINQRISQAAVRRLNSLAARLERGLPGSSFAPGSITSADLAPDLRE